MGYQANPADGCPWRNGLLPDIHSNTITPNPQKSTCEGGGKGGEEGGGGRGRLRRGRLRRRREREIEEGGGRREREIELGGGRGESNNEVLLYNISSSFLERCG